MRIFLALALAVSAVAGLPGQTPSNPAQDDVIRTNTNLIQVRAVVTDRAGKPVENLKQDDFEVLENGRPQTVSVFSLERIQNNSNSSGPAEPNEANTANTTTSRTPPRPSRTIVLFVDTLHLSPLSLLKAKLQLKRFVDEQITDKDLVGIVTTSDSLGVFGQYMRDRKLLKYAIDKISGFARPNTLFTPYLASRVLSENALVPPQPPLPPGGRQASMRSPASDLNQSLSGQQALSVAQAIMAGEDGIDPNDDLVRARARELLGEETILRRTTLQILKAVSERMAAVPGQRLIAFVSDGFTLRDANGGADNDDFGTATSRAVRAGVVIYSFSPQGLTTPIEYTASSAVHFDSSNPTLGVALGSYMSDSRTESQSILRELAAETGGEAYLNNNDVVGQFNKMLSANDVYYAVGYYFHDESDHKFRSIKVRVKNHPEYHVRAQRGYQLANESSAEVAGTPQQKLFRAMMAPLPLMNIAVTSSANFLARADDDAKVSLDVHFDGRSIEFEQADQKYKLNCEVAVAVLDAHGKVSEGVAETVTGSFVAEQIEKARRDGFRYTKRIALAPGIYQLRVGVRDVNSELMGTASSWVNVPDLRKKKLILSDLFLGRQNRDDKRTEAFALNERSATAKLLIGPASFDNGEVIFYRLVLYNSAADNQSSSGKSLKVEVLNSNDVVYEGSWQPLGGKIIRKDSLGIEIGGEIRMTSAPGVYTLRITIKDSKGTVQQTREFELQK